MLLLDTVRLKGLVRALEVTSSAARFPSRCFDLTCSHANIFYFLLNHKRGLELVCQSGWANVLLETDSLHSINMLTKAYSVCHQWGAIIEDINKLLSDNPGFKIRHIFREANYSVDFMAKLGSNYDESEVIWDNLPPGIESRLFADWDSTAYPRTWS
ncbi:ribonuclease H [Senna tora]|uniref:Ribonuclease H n=1 Tax=Senna tora TaxID=362788 RepID=A0A835CAD0_9FABA|nr:ribonuclease H [Senna tora]